MSARFIEVTSMGTGPGIGPMLINLDRVHTIEPEEDGDEKSTAQIWFLAKGDEDPERLRVNESYRDLRDQVLR